jgi:hypothetical protein
LTTPVPTAAPATISGRITTADGQPLAGTIVVLNGSGQSIAITDSSGYYEFDNLATSNFYTLTPKFANYSFSPANLSFSLLADKTDAAFTATPDATAKANPLDTAVYFVRQQYLDFLGREPDSAGLTYWSGRIEECGNDGGCSHQRRIDVSAAFFMSEEFQATGSFVYRLYRGALGRQLSYPEFSQDRQQVVGGSSLDTAKAAFAGAFVQRSEFVQKYRSATTAASFVDALIQTMKETSGADLSPRRSTLISDYNSSSSLNESRSLAVREAIEDASFQQAEYDRAFVLMQYFGYLRRDPDAGGYGFWLDVLSNRVPGNYRAMVCAFLTSSEYQRRFGSVVTRDNRECGP